MSLNFLKNALIAYDLFRKRFRCEVATGSLLQSCLEVRHQVFGEELCRWGKRKQKKGAAMADQYDPVSLHLACIDRSTRRVVGSLRVTKGHYFKRSSPDWKEYHLDLFPKKFLPRVGIATRFAILKEYRDSAAGFAMISKVYECNFTHIKAAVSVIVCEPNLYPLYRQLGYRPLDRVFVSSYGGYRLPLFLIPHDYESLQHMGSPLYKVAKRYSFPREKEGFEWYFKYAQKRGAISPGFSMVSTENNGSFRSHLFRGLSQEAIRLLLKNAIVVQCEPGDVVIKKWGGEKNIGFVKKGAVEVRDAKNKVLMVMGEGDVFGELAMILNIPRSANIVSAMPHTEVTLLSPSAISRIEDEKDQIQIWKNMANLLAQRLIHTSTHIPSYLKMPSWLSGKSSTP